MSLFSYDQFINKIGGGKAEQSKGGKKFRHMTSMLTKVQEAIHEMEVKKTPEYAMYPKIDLVRMNPTALNTQEVWNIMIYCTMLMIYEPHHEKSSFSHMRTTKAQIRLHECAVWSAPLLFSA